MISAREAARLVGDVAGVQPSTVVLRRAVTASDGLGGRTNTFGPVATVAARITPVSSDVVEKVVGERLRDQMVWKVALPAGTDVRQGDRIAADGVTYAIEAVRGGRSVEVERVVYVTRAAR